MNQLDAAAVERAGTGEPVWRTELRRTAHDHYDKLSAPSSAEELWRYVDLDFAIDDYGLVDEPGDLAAPSIDGLDGAHHVSVVDGVVRSVEGEQSDRTWIGSIRSLPGDIAGAIEQAAVGGVPANTDVFAAAHGAFGSDEVVRALDISSVRPSRMLNGTCLD